MDSWVQVASRTRDVNEAHARSLRISMPNREHGAESAPPFLPTNAENVRFQGANLRLPHSSPDCDQRLAAMGSKLHRRVIGPYSLKPATKRLFQRRRAKTTCAACSRGVNLNAASSPCSSADVCKLVDSTPAALQPIEVAKHSAHTAAGLAGRFREFGVPPH
jgi:hypothetical protein